ncbi:MAG: hypothetical protein H7Y07_04955 [Pyrinomonadaceae bacterium]|nr:hypothetical protein [Sphingobacteriaceae bacterium]
MIKSPLRLVILGLIFLSCGRTPESKDISSIDTVKKYISGTWCNRRNTKETLKYEFEKDYRGLQLEGLRDDNDQIAIGSNPATFELIKPKDTVAIEFTYLLGTSVEKVKYISDRKLVLGNEEFYKINSR